jgi:hypothetical protein
MKFKSTEGFNVFLNKEGKITIEQESYEFGKLVHVCLTLEQFYAIGYWVLEHKDDIELVWNDGVEDDSEA